MNLRVILRDWLNKPSREEAERRAQHIRKMAQWDADLEAQATGGPAPEWATGARALEAELLGAFALAAMDAPEKMN